MAIRDFRRSASRYLFAASQGLLAVAIAAALVGCSGGALMPEPSASAESVVQPLPSPTFPPTVPPATDTPTAAPTEIPHEFRSYQHPSGVFGLTIPADWETLDDSTDQRLLVRFIPPVGYGSRVTVDVTNEGPLTPDDVRALAESYVHLQYISNPAYTEISRSTLPDGRLQFVYLYDDSRGGKGRETLTAWQVGPYFAALRVFLSDRDTFTLSQAMDTVLSSFNVNALAVWGSAVAAINPAELVLVNSALWHDDQGITHYGGEVYNTSHADITNVQVKVALCNNTGIVMTELTQPAALAIVPSGSSTPFEVTASGMPTTISVCSQQATADPAPPNSPITTALSLQPSAGYDRQHRLTINAVVQNPGLSPITDVDVILVVYDADGRVIGYHTVSYGATLELAAGDSQDVSYTFPSLGAEAARFAALGQARVETIYSHSLAPGNGP